MLTREDIDKAPWLGAGIQREQVLELLARAEGAEILLHKVYGPVKRLVEAVEVLADTPTHPEAWQILTARAAKVREVMP